MDRNNMAGSVVLPKCALSRGIASLFDFHGSLDLGVIQEIRDQYQIPPRKPSPEDAIRSTWQAVGDSMRWAIGEYEKELDDKEQE